MNDRETILGLIERYKTAIHTGAAEDFFPIWAEEHPTTLISIGRKFSGTENIYHEFVAGLIQKAYSRIDLITRGRGNPADRRKTPPSPSSPTTPTASAGRPASPTQSAGLRPRSTSGKRGRGS